MGEITKLYENTGVLKECLSPCYINKIWRKTHDCPNCDNRKNYPSFTAEKQIELIKWLSSKYGLYIVDKYSIGFGECIGDFCIKEDFEEALAGGINSLWQDLTEEERKQIKEILE